MQLSMNLAVTLLFQILPRRWFTKWKKGLRIHPRKNRKEFRAEVFWGFGYKMLKRKQVRIHAIR